MPASGHELAWRVASALILAAVAVAALSAGVMAFAALVAAGAAVLAWEWTRLCGVGRFGVAGAAQAATVVAVAGSAMIGRPDVAAGLIGLGTAVVYAAARRGGFLRPAWVAAGTIYIGLPTVALLWLRGDAEAGRAMVLWLLVTVWATDIGAYFAGRMVGGRRLAPRLSPNKTWAGLMGAVAAASLVGVAVARLDPASPGAALLAAAGATMALVAQAGDLGESWIKRRFGVKDASHLIPGHGGLFDRVDGLVAAASMLAVWQWTSGGLGLSWR
ncbi:MAG: phosphatidate cytidylyltransferase [Pseudomonadota bacterium]